MQFLCLENKPDSELSVVIRQVRGHGVPDSAPRVLVGNKCDQVTPDCLKSAKQNFDYIEALRFLCQGDQVVTTSTAQRWADDRGMPLFETSAKDDSVADHVDGIFLTLAHKLREGRAMIEPLSDPSNPDNRPVSIMPLLQTIDFHLFIFPGSSFVHKQFGSAT